MISPSDIEQLCIVLSARCNLACGYCYQNARPPGRMSLRTLRACVDLLSSSPRRCVELVFLGGEPLLELDLLRRGVEYAKERHTPRQYLRMSVVTNGTLITDEVADFLAGESIETYVSFDGIRRSQEARCRGTFETLDRLLDRLRERWPSFFRRNVIVTMTLTPRTVPDLSESYDYFLDKDVRRVTVSPVITRSPDWRLADIDELEGQFSRVVESSRRQLERTGRIPLAFPGGDVRFSPPGVGRMMCNILTNDSPAVDLDGTAYGCAVFAQSYQEPRNALLREAIRAMRIAKLTDPDFADRYRGFPAAPAALRMFTHKERKFSGYRRCSDCPHFDECLVCPASIAQEGGDPDRIPDFSCAYNIVSLEHRAALPAVPSLRDRVRGEDHRERRDTWRAVAEAVRAAGSPT